MAFRTNGEVLEGMGGIKKATGGEVLWSRYEKVGEVQSV